MESYNSCKICNGQIKLINVIHNLVRCDVCELIFCKSIYSDEQISNTYDELYNKSEKYTPYLREFEKLEKQNNLRLGWPKRSVINHVLKKNVKSVCEIGAGVGLVGVYLKAKQLNYLGIEMDETTAKKASSLGIDVRTGSFKQLADHSEKFDAILGFEVIEHIQELKDFFLIVNRSLKPGGLLGFSVPNYNKVLNYPEHRDRLHQDGPPIHVNFFTNNSLTNVLTNAGFKISFLRIKPRPYFNFRKPATYYFMLKALVGKYHGPTIIGLAEKCYPL